MADVVTSLGTFLIQIIETIFHNLIGVGIFILLAIIVWKKFLTEKPPDMQKIVFDKQFEAIAERLAFPKPKTLALCNYPHDVEQLRKSQYLLNFIPQGTVIGANVIPIKNSFKRIIEMNKGIPQDKIDELMKQNKEYIDDDIDWFVYAYRKKTGSIFGFFPQYKKALLFCKPNQVINQNSNDDLIRIRGFGITPKGEYELINDENSNINSKQLMMDALEDITDQTTFYAYAKMGEIVTEAIKSDSLYRKKSSIEGLISNRNRPTEKDE